MFKYGRKKFGEYLVQRDKVSSGQVETALAYQQEHKDLRIGEIIHRLRFLDKEELLKELAEFLDKKYVMTDRKIMSENVKDIFNLEFMQANHFAPFELEDKVLKIAIHDINNFELKEAIDSIASKRGLQTEYYLTLAELVGKYLENSFMEKISGGKDIPHLVDYIIEEGIQRNSSDIHIEPVNREKVKIRYRVDGQLVPSKLNIMKSEYDEVVSRLKIMANLNTTEKRRSQDGHIPDFTTQSGQVFDIRISVILVAHGEKVVLRLLNKNQKIKDLRELGFNDYQVSVINRSIRHRNGIVFVTGATGTGKSTSLYTILDILNNTNLNIVTIENPIERTIEGLNQININEAIGISFSSTLRTVLRQDPDIIMVGEIRDKETLSIALEASMTGHLVLTTLHTNSAEQIIDRINSMGVDMYNFAASLLLVVSQKLIRKLCPHCKQKYAPSGEELEYMQEVLGRPVDRGISLFRSSECSRCNQGYLGREVICEVFEKDERIEDLLLKKVSSRDVLEYLNTKGYSPMIHQAVEKVLNGITSLEEVRSIFVD